MAEFIFRVVGAAIEAAIDALIAYTGKRVLSLWGVKSNPFVQVLIGLIFWAIIGVVLAVFIAVLFVKP
jgi:hypothetical protein